MVHIRSCVVVVRKISDGVPKVSIMFTKLVDSVNAYFRSRETERQLNSLSDAALADIGLTRGGIADVCTRREPLRRRPATTAGSLYANSAIWNAAQPA